MATTHFTQDHEWIRVDGDTGVVGISDYAQQQLGDVVFVELPEVGKTVQQGSEAAVVESVKAASEVYAPVSGEVTAVNPCWGDYRIDRDDHCQTPLGHRAWSSPIFINYVPET